MTRLLIDTDAFCKLAAVGLFVPAIRVLSGDPQKVERLAALPHMLRKGRLRRQLGEQLADSLIDAALALPVVPANQPDALSERLTSSELDPGEVQLLWLAAQSELLILTSDKRAVRTASTIEELRPRIQGKVVVLEAVLIALCNQHGASEVRTSVLKNPHIDTIFKTCFSSEMEDPRFGLQSHLSALEHAVQPLRLWTPEETT